MGGDGRAGPAPDDTPIARSFGARVDFASGSSSLCLVATRGSPQPAINAVGGRVLAALSATQVIAVVDMSLFSQLQRHPDVLRAGAVTVDPERFARFQRLIGL